MLKKVRKVRRVGRVRKVAIVMGKNKINVRFVQLEPAAFLSDVDVQMWNATEVGCYWLILLYLYTNNGRVPNDQKGLSRICRCPRNFVRIWNKIAHKFIVAGAFLCNKRVDRELQAALSRYTQTHLAGVKSAKKRWGCYNGVTDSVTTKESKGNVIEEKGIKTSNSKQGMENIDADIHKTADKDTNTISKINSSFSTSVRDKENPFQKAMDVLKNRVVSGAVGSTSLTTGGEKKPVSSADNQTRVLQFSEKLNAVIRPRTQSDRTCFRKVANFFGGQIEAGKCGAEIFTHALHLAEEAAKGRNPAACFMALVKKELNYR
jgi:uncharacterized protein YdaU (DUF1376 family)